MRHFDRGYFVCPETPPRNSAYYDPKTPPDNAQLAKNGMDCYHVCGMYSEALKLAGGLI